MTGTAKSRAFFIGKLAVLSRQLDKIDPMWYSFVMDFKRSTEKMCKELRIIASDVLGVRVL